VLGPTRSRGSRQGLHLRSKINLCSFSSLVMSDEHRRRGVFQYRKWTLVQLALRCWGEMEEGEGWGDHAIQHAMKHAHSPDLATVIRAYLGDDHRENVEREVLPYLRLLLSTTQITIEHMLLQLPPVLFDESFNVEKHLPRMQDRWVAVEGVPVNVKGAIGVDGAAASELGGLTYHDEKNASPFNDDRGTSTAERSARFSRCHRATAWRMSVRQGGLDSGRRCWLWCSG
jgi:hypothetical protein